MINNTVIKKTHPIILPNYKDGTDGVHTLLCSTSSARLSTSSVSKSKIFANNANFSLAPSSAAISFATKIGSFNN